MSSKLNKLIALTLIVSFAVTTQSFAASKFQRRTHIGLEAELDNSSGDIAFSRASILYSETDNSQCYIQFDQTEDAIKCRLKDEAIYDRQFGRLDTKAVIVETLAVVDRMHTHKTTLPGSSEKLMDLQENAFIRLKDFDSLLPVDQTMAEDLIDYMQAAFFPKSQELPVAERINDYPLSMHNRKLIAEGEKKFWMRFYYDTVSEVTEPLPDQTEAAL